MIYLQSMIPRKYSTKHSCDYIHIEASELHYEEQLFH